jgi:hypothetical protein
VLSDVGHDIVDEPVKPLVVQNYKDYSFLDKIAAILAYWRLLNTSSLADLKYLKRGKFTMYWHNKFVNR